MPLSLGPRRRVTSLVLWLCLGPSPLAAQDQLDSLAARLVGMTAISGYERAMVDTVARLLPGAVRDRAGNLVLEIGTGAPHLLLACPLDEAGYVVGGIRGDGYLTLRRVGPGAGPRADERLQGQRVTVFGRNGAVPGVVGVRSVHLTRGRGPAPGFTLDDAYIDVGAASAAEATALGIGVLSPVARTKSPHHYGADLLAAPSAGRRAACAALLAAARHPGVVAGRITIAFVVEQRFTGRGLLTLRHERGPFSMTVLVDGEPAPAHWDPGFGTVDAWLVPVRYAGTPVETVSLTDVRALGQRLRSLTGGTP
jgi:putative aminopeptidase FrvX